MKIPAQTEQDLLKFIESGLPGSITFHSDGKAFRQVEIKTIRRYEHGDEKEKGR
jgi:hypothetical protein